MHPDNTSSKLQGEEAAVQRQAGIILPNQRFHSGLFAAETPTAGKAIRGCGEGGCSPTLHCREVCKLQKESHLFDGAVLACTVTSAAGLDFLGLLRATLPLSIWGDIQLFYKIGHLSTLVLLPVDSAEIATAQKNSSPETPRLGRHSPPPRESLAPGTEPGRGLGTSLSLPFPAAVQPGNGTTGFCLYFQTY